MHSEYRTDSDAIYKNRQIIAFDFRIARRDIHVSRQVYDLSKFPSTSKRQKGTSHQISKIILDYRCEPKNNNYGLFSLRNSRIKEILRETSQFISIQK